jgi:hypothetical protein
LAGKFLMNRQVPAPRVMISSGGAPSVGASGVLGLVWSAIAGGPRRSEMSMRASAPEIRLAIAATSLVREPGSAYPWLDCLT